MEGGSKGKSPTRKGSAFGEMTPKCWTGLVSSNEHWSERELERWPLRDRLTQGIKRCFARTHQRKVVALS